MAKDTESSARLRETLEKKRSDLILRFGVRRAHAIIYGGLITIGVLAALILTFFLLPVREIEVTGEAELFNESEIIRAASLELGDSLMLRSSGSLERAIKKNMPLAESVEVKKTLTGRVSIDVSFKEVDFYCNANGKYCAIDEELRVLWIDPSPARYLAFGAMKVILPEVREPEIGEVLVFYDTVEETDTEGETLYEVRKPDYYAYVSEFLSCVKENGYTEGSDCAVLNEKFNLRLIYAEKFMLRFGKVSDLELKFRIFYEIMSEGSIDYADKVTVELSNTSAATARADNTLDFDEYLD